jgi:hypothetical protein
MNNYAIALSVEPFAPLWNWHGSSGSRDQQQERTSASQFRAAPARRAHTQLTHQKFYVSTFSEASTVTAPVISDPGAATWGVAPTLTQTVNELAVTTDAYPAVESEERRDVDQIAHERMMLLARKYANRGTTETLARLERLSGLLLEISPRIKDNQIAALERTQALLQRGETERAERVRRRAARKEGRTQAELQAQV